MRNEGPIISSALTDELKRKGKREVFFSFKMEGRGGGVGEIGRSEVREGKGGRLLQASEEKGGRGQKKTGRKKQRKSLRRGKREEMQTS